MLALNKAKPAADPLRDALTAAKRKADEVHQAIDRQRRAIEKTRQIVRELEHAIKQADEKIEQAQREYAVALAAAGDGPAPASGVKTARAAAQEVRDELDARKAALAQMREVIPEWEGAADDAEIALEGTISEILAQHAMRLIEEVLPIVHQLAPLQSLLHAFERHYDARNKPHDTASRGREPLADVAQRVNELLHQVSAAPSEFPDFWTMVREQLRADPHAPLPDFAVEESR